MHIFLDFMQKGGVTMWPLLACSVVDLTLILERIYFFLTYKEEKFFLLVDKMLPFHKNPQIVKENILWEHEKIVTKGFSALSLIVSLSPLLGLFGTILGLVHVYFKLGFSTDNSHRETVMSSGIAEALFTTLAGLAIAIPALFFTAIFRARADVLMRSFELKIKEKLLAEFHEEKNG